LNVFYKNSRLKQYLKDGVALRIETVVNDPKDLRCNRLLANLSQLHDKAREIYDLLLKTGHAGQGTTLVIPVMEPYPIPTLTPDAATACSSPTYTSRSTITSLAR